MSDPPPPPPPSPDISGETPPRAFQQRAVTLRAGVFCQAVSPDLNQYGWERSSSGGAAAAAAATQGGSMSAATTDANFMDLAYRLARNSYCIEGNMGCVFVSNIPVGRGGDSRPLEPPAQIVCQSVNTACFNPFHSDCHAEANGVAACAAHGQPLSGTTCYVTRAPCSECFKLLCMARVKRIVCPQEPASKRCADKVEALGIEWVRMRDSQDAARERDAACAAFEDWDRIAALRVERKRQRALHREQKKTEKAKRVALEARRKESKRIADKKREREKRGNAGAGTGCQNNGPSSKKARVAAES